MKRSGPAAPWFNTWARPTTSPGCSTSPRESTSRRISTGPKSTPTSTAIATTTISGESTETRVSAESPPNSWATPRRPPSKPRWSTTPAAARPTGSPTQLAIAGTIHDDREIVAFRAGLDGMNPADYVSVLAEVDAGGHFLFDQARLEAILGGSVANNGPHTLAPRGRGRSRQRVGDALRRDVHVGHDCPGGADGPGPARRRATWGSTTTTTSRRTTRRRSLPRPRPPRWSGCTSSIDGYVGEAIAASPVSITTPALADGDHDFTATATDLAGNISGVSAPLSVLIETVAPGRAHARPGRRLRHRNARRPADVAGERDARGPGRGPVADDADQYRRIGDGRRRPGRSRSARSRCPSATIRSPSRRWTWPATPAASRRPSSRTTLRRAGAYGPIAVDEDPGAKTYDLAGVFTDVNLVAGDTLTLSIVGNTNPGLVTPSLTGTSGQVTNNSLRLTFGQDRNGTATITVRATDAAGEYADDDHRRQRRPGERRARARGHHASYTSKRTSLVDVDLRTRFKDVETADDNLAFATRLAHRPIWLGHGRNPRRRTYAPLHAQHERQRTGLHSSQGNGHRGRHVAREDDHRHGHFQHRSVQRSARGQHHHAGDRRGHRGRGRLVDAHERHGDGRRRLVVCRGRRGTRLGPVGRRPYRPIHPGGQLQRAGQLHVHRDRHGRRDESGEEHRAGDDQRDGQPGQRHAGRHCRRR